MAGFYKPFKRILVGIFVFMIIRRGISMLMPCCFGRVIDIVIAGSMAQTAFLWIGVALVIYTIDSALGYFQDKLEIKHLDFDVHKSIAWKTLNKIMGFSIGQHQNENSGLRQSVIEKGQHSCCTLAYLTIYDIMPLIVEIGLIMAALFYLNYILGLVMFAGMTLFIASIIYTNIWLRKEMVEFNDLGYKNDKIYTEILRNVCLIQTNAQEYKMISEYDNHLGNFNQLGKKLWIKYAASNIIKNLVIGITKCVILIIAVCLIYKGIYTPGYLVIFWSWSSNAFNQIGRVGFIHKQCLGLYVAIKKYFMMLDIEPAIKIISNPVPVDDLKGRIEFKNISFKYPMENYFEGIEDEEEEDNSSAKDTKKDDYHILYDVNFVIEPGQKVAFVGHSGAGKSTIIQLLLRAHDPDRGQIIIDGNDLRILDLNRYRQSIGLVEQSVELFDSTLRKNIVFSLNGRGHLITDEELERMAKLCAIDKFFHRLEKGFDTPIGEKGVKLSGGERQRVGIARALIKEPKILILDEATSNLDSENETLIRESINLASKGRTTIIIAHRLSTIKDVDNIFVMERGRIIGQGKHEELLTSCDAYTNLISKQMVGVL